ncbi:hypothetical protein LzC2_40740 [Planctomycetes bacterium LzC2]|uniref:Uncharacterized protein n=2 Tax=Alienimonas chondri TaxID=2681879 RepID=A0ABX1VJ56_9PLAN|nr:hypothetical protein [Alienimonas chondri]
MRLLLGALGPIDSTEVAALGPPDYQLNYHAGMDPTTINIRRDGNGLRFQIDGRYGREPYVYGTDDATRFTAALEQVRGLTEAGPHDWNGNDITLPPELRLDHSPQPD